MSKRFHLFLQLGFLWQPAVALVVGFVL